MVNTSQRGRSRRLVVVVTGLAMLAAACGGPSDEGEGAAPEPASPSVAAWDDEALALWADDLTRALENLSTGGDNEPLDPSVSGQAAAFSHLQNHGAWLRSSVAVFPTSPGGGELLTRRYEDLRAALDLMATVDSRLSGANAAEPIEGGIVRDFWTKAESDVEAACFGVQEVLDADGIGLGACVGLSLADDVAFEVYDSIATDGFGLLDTALLGAVIEPEQGAQLSADYFVAPWCLAGGSVAADRSVAEFTVSLASAATDHEGVTWLMEVWVFADPASRRSFETALRQLFETRKISCLREGALARLTNGTDGDGSVQTLPPGSSTGFEVTGIPSADGRTLFSQFAYTDQGSVLAVVSTAGEGTLPPVALLDEVAGLLTVGGSRP